MTKDIKCTLFTRFAVLAACCLALTLSCKREAAPGEEVQEERYTPDESSPVSFAPTADAMSTKGATGVTQSSIVTSGFGVTVYWRNYGYVFDGAKQQYDMPWNVRPTYKGVIGGKPTWGMDPVMYWPVKGSLSFFAYAPWMSNTDPHHVIQPNYGADYPGGHFVQDTNSSSMIDFCIAAPQYDLTGDDGTVNLAFEHALTKVLFYLNIKGVVYPGEDYSYRIKSVTLSGFAGENTYIYGNGDKPFHWLELPRHDLSSRTATYTLTRSAGELVPTLIPHEKDLGGVTGLDRYVLINDTDAGALFMLPQPMASTCKVTFVLTACTVSGSTVTEVQDLDPIDVWLPETTVWEPGKIVAYLISLDTTTWVETLFRMSITNWSDTSYAANIFENAVYVSRSGGSCTITKVSNGFTAGDLSVNPPSLYVNGASVAVSSWSHVGTVLTAVTASGTYTFNLSGGQPVSVSYSA